ncbi:MAG: AMP-binding protein [Streptosporangiales bacterium]|nr:AMP-binding protein [Streptosporangiales bacterium]
MRVTASTQPYAAPATHPGLRPDSRLTPGLVSRYLADGSWARRTLRSFLDDAADAEPDRVAAVAYRSDGGRVGRVTYSELDELVHRLAAGLADLGIAPGDGVAVMLPNGLEFGALIFAINEAGAVYTGIPVAYGEREMRSILRRSRARALVLPASFRGVSPLGVARGIRHALPHLEHLVVLGDADLGPGELSFEVLRHAKPRRGPAVDPGALCHVGFTSGTTGEPKGVMNTHQTLEAVLRGWVGHVDAHHLGQPLVNLVASPVGHHTGFLWGVLMAAYLRGTAVYLDRWDPAAAAEVIRAEAVTALVGAPTFLQDLMHTDLGAEPGAERGAGRDDAGSMSLRMVVLAGAPVPRALPAEASARLGCQVCPAWGMTEYGIGISWAPSLGERALVTDGRPVPGCEVRIVGSDEGPAEPGQPGDLEIRGAGLFLGYFEQPEATAAAFSDGWFRTGDTALVDSDGLVHLQGRTKDIIIRGGENIPVVDVESLLFAHPDIVDAAVIGVPDPRLGERACAVVVPAGGARLDLAGVTGYLLDNGLSKHFLPERLEVVEQIPKTASGKIRKVELRERFGG